MSKFRKPGSYLMSTVIHGVLGYLIINTAVRVAMPEGDVVEVSVNGIPPKGEQTLQPQPNDVQPEEPKPQPVAKPEDTQDVPAAPKHHPHRIAKTLPPPPRPKHTSVKPLPIVKERLSDVHSADDQEAPEVKTAQEEQPPEKPEEKTVPPIEPVPMPPTHDEETDASHSEGEETEPQQKTAVVPPTTRTGEQTSNPQQVTGQGLTQQQQLAQYGVPTGAVVKDASLLAARPGNRPPQYPYISRLRRQQGAVQLLAYIDANGHIEKLFVEKSSGFPALDREAFDAFQKWLFYPGQADWVRKTFNFRLKD